MICCDRCLLGASAPGSGAAPSCPASPVYTAAPPQPIDWTAGAPRGAAAGEGASALISGRGTSDVVTAGKARELVG